MTPPRPRPSAAGVRLHRRDVRLSSTAGVWWWVGLGGGPSSRGGRRPAVAVGPGGARCRGLWIARIQRDMMRGAVLESRVPKVSRRGTLKQTRVLDFLTARAARINAPKKKARVSSASLFVSYFRETWQLVKLKIEYIFEYFLGKKKQKCSLDISIHIETGIFVFSAAIFLTDASYLKKTKGIFFCARQLKKRCGMVL